MTWVLIVIDKTQRTIYLSKERWRHIASEHPNITNELYLIKQTLENPAFIKTSQHDINVRFYYCHKKQENKYLLVVVKYLNGKGFIITSFKTHKP